MYLFPKFTSPNQGIFRPTRNAPTKCNTLQFLQFIQDNNSYQEWKLSRWYGPIKFPSVGMVLALVFTVDHEVGPWNMAVFNGLSSWSNFHGLSSSKISYENLGPFSRCNLNVDQEE